MIEGRENTDIDWLKWGTKSLAGLTISIFLPVVDLVFRWCFLGFHHGDDVASGFGKGQEKPSRNFPIRLKTAHLWKSTVSS